MIFENYTPEEVTKEKLEALSTKDLLSELMYIIDNVPNILSLKPVIVHFNKELKTLKNTEITHYVEAGIIKREPRLELTKQNINGRIQYALSTSEIVEKACEALKSDESYDYK